MKNLIALGLSVLLYSWSILPWLFLFLRNRNIVFFCVFYKSFVAFLLLLLVQRISDVAAHRISIPVICLVPLINPFIERNPRFVLYDYFLTCILLLFYHGYIWESIENHTNVSHLTLEKTSQKPKVFCTLPSSA